MSRASRVFDPSSAEPVATGAPATASVAIGGFSSRAPTSFEPGLALKRNFAWAFVGNAVYSASQFAIVVAIARLGSPELLGKYSLALALTAPAFMLTNLNLSAVLAADARSRYAFSDYLGLRLVASLIAVATANACAAAAGYPVSTVCVVVPISLAKFIEAVEDIAYGLMQKNERMDLATRSMIANSVLSLAGIAVALILTGSLVTAMLSLAAVRVAVLSCYDLRVARGWAAVRPRFRRATLRALVWTAGPLGAVAGLNSLGQQLPRIFIERFYGDRELGLFSAVAALGLIHRNFTTALSRSALPRLARLWTQGSAHGFRMLLLSLVGAGAFVGAGGVAVAALLGEPLLRAMYGPEYASQKSVLALIMLAAGIAAAATFLGTAATAAQRFGSQAFVHLVKLAVIAGFARVAVPRLGALGAAWALVAGAAFSSGAYFFIALRTAPGLPPPHPRHIEHEP